MVIIKAPTKHGLDRKFKPWRRGKSEKSNKRSSLKQQLRGIERLMQKLPEEEKSKDQRDELQKKMVVLKQEIDVKQNVIQEKKHADKAHGQRFLDRQRLTRQEKKARKQESTADMESQLFKIALDEIYVAHHPNDIKYMPLFRKGERVVDTSRHLFRRAVTRKRILKSLTKDRQNCKWIPKDQYERLPSVEWTIEDEERVFGGSVTRQGAKDLKKSLEQKNQDSRFELAAQHDAVLQVADQVQEELEEEETGGKDSKEGNSANDVSDNQATKEPKRETSKSSTAKDDVESDDSSDTSDSDDDKSDEADPLKQLEKTTDAVAKRKRIEQAVEGSKSSDSDSSDDSSSDDDDIKKDQGKEKDADDSSDDDSDSSSDSSDEEEADVAESSEKKVPKINPKDNVEPEVDDFLMDANNDEDMNVFSMTLKRVPALEVRGDKSKGWESQRQRPGQFKKRRERR